MDNQQKDKTLDLAIGQIEKEFVADGKIQTSTRKSTINNSESIIKERANV